MLINELADRTGLSTHTIRFYEKEGFLDERFLCRGENNYRNYQAAAVERLLTIKAGQSAGFTLKELRELLAICDGGTLTPQLKMGFLRQKIEDINRKKADLARVETYLAEIMRQIEAEALAAAQ